MTRQGVEELQFLGAGHRERRRTMHIHPTTPPALSPLLVRLLTLLALALSSVTAVSVWLAMGDLIDKPLLAMLFGAAAVLLDLFKYAAWPLALYMLAARRRACAALLVGCALVLSGVSGWATYDRLMSSIATSRAQHAALQEQRIADLEEARRTDAALLGELADEARAVRPQAAVLRERGMASRALELESVALERIDRAREQALARQERASLELTALRGRQVKAAGLPEGAALLLCLGFAAALEVVPALVLSAVRPLGQARQAAPAPVAGMPMEPVNEPRFLVQEPEMETRTRSSGPVPETAPQPSGTAPETGLEPSGTVPETGALPQEQVEEPAPEAAAVPGTPPETVAAAPPEHGLDERDAELLQVLLENTVSAGPGAKITVKGFARTAKIGNDRAGLVFRAAETIGAIRKTPAGYVAA